MAVVKKFDLHFVGQSTKMWVNMAYQQAIMKA